MDACARTGLREGFCSLACHFCLIDTFDPTALTRNRYPRHLAGRSALVKVDLLYRLRIYFDVLSPSISGSTFIQPFLWRSRLISALKHDVLISGSWEIGSQFNIRHVFNHFQSRTHSIQVKFILRHILNYIFYGSKLILERRSYMHVILIISPVN